MPLRSALTSLTVLALLAAGAVAQQQQRTRAEFMRQKLVIADSLLEGLTVENYDQIEKGARSLKRMSQAAEWQVPTIPNVEEYLPRTAEFQRICDDILKSARDKNLDGATLGYSRLAVSCVDCHKYVRAAK